MTGCGEDEGKAGVESLYKELVGTYDLLKSEVSEDGAKLEVEPPKVSGTMTISSDQKIILKLQLFEVSDFGTGSFEIFPDEGIVLIDFETEDMIARFTYTWDGEILTMAVDTGTYVGKQFWRKLNNSVIELHPPYPQLPPEEEEMKDDSDEFKAVDTTWQAVSINGLKFEQLFTPAEPTEYETDFTIEGNSWTFSSDGSFTGTLKFILIEKYPEPVSSMKQEIDINSAGDYTVEGTTLKITKHDLTIDVDVTLEPKEVWEQQIVGKTVEELEDDLAAETKLGFSPTATTALFREGTEFTWRHEEDSFTLSTLTQTIVLQRAVE